MATPLAAWIIFDLICNAQQRVSTRPSHAPASSRHVECTCSLIPIIPKPSRRGPTRRLRPAARLEQTGGIKTVPLAASSHCSHQVWQLVWLRVRFYGPGRDGRDHDYLTQKTHLIRRTFECLLTMAICLFAARLVHAPSPHAPFASTNCIPSWCPKPQLSRRFSLPQKAPLPSLLRPNLHLTA
jgi:hypothetical protein